MNSRSVRRPALAALLLAPVLALSACGGDDGPSVSEPGQAEETTGATVEETTPAETQEPTESETTTPEDTATTSSGSQTTAPGDEGGDQAADPQAEQEEVAEVVEAYFDGMGDKDGEAVCDLMSNLDNSGPLKDNAAMRDGCADGVAGAGGFENITPEQAEQMKAVEVTGAEIDGDTAVVRPEHLEGAGVDASAAVELPLVKIDGTWYIDSMKVATMSPGSP